MGKLKGFYCAALVAMAFLLAQAVSAFAQGSEQETVAEATAVLETLAAIPEQSIPPVLLRQAQAVVVIPAAVKLGFMVAGRYGQGLMVGRDEKGAWGLPFLVTLVSGSVGWQAGLQATDIVLVFKSRKGLYAVRDGKFTLGADASLAVGPVGRHLEAATDLGLRTEVYSYSRSKGAFIGAALEGSVLQADRRATQRLYGQAPEAITRQSVRKPGVVSRFERILAAMTR